MRITDWTITYLNRIEAWIERRPRSIWLSTALDSLDRTVRFSPNHTTLKVSMMLPRKINELREASAFAIR